VNKPRPSYCKRADLTPKWELTRCYSQCVECARAVSSEAEQRPHKAQGDGSTPSRPTITEAWVEQWRRKLHLFWVEGQHDEINHLCDLALDGVRIPATGDREIRPSTPAESLSGGVEAGSRDVLDPRIKAFIDGYRASEQARGDQQIDPLDCYEKATAYATSLKAATLDELESANCIERRTRRRLEMKEYDYIQATNLAKLRIALQCVRDTLVVGTTDELRWKTETAMTLAHWVEMLEKKVK
jgi:hypothetical protein